MPVKTKREKLLAQLHRQSGTSRNLSTPHQDENLSFVRHDVVKTLIFGGIAIAIEFFLYWNQAILL